MDMAFSTNNYLESRHRSVASQQENRRTKQSDSMVKKDEELLKDVFPTLHSVKFHKDLSGRSLWLKAMLKQKQNPGLAYACYEVKSMEGDILEEGERKLGQLKRQEGEILALAESLRMLMEKGVYNSTIRIINKPGEQASIDPTVNRALGSLKEISNQIQDGYLCELK